MYKRYIKRFFDFIISAFLSPFVIIAIVICSIAIIIDDGFPVFYIAQRRGIHGSVFNMYKLRSMKKNSPDIRNKDGSTFNSKYDYRLTRVGSILRMLSIDELPQIFNVLIGEMSFVGPRPSLVSKDYTELNEFAKKRLEVLPGITGYSQAFFRNSISQEEKIRMDCWYVDHISFLTDIRIFCKTVQSVLLRKNIYK